MFYPGDTIGIKWTFGITHKGIVVGYWPDGGLAISHNSKERGKVVIDDLNGFSSGEISFLIDRPSTPAEKFHTVTRAMEQTGKDYETVVFNCDHHTSYARTGVAESPQLWNGLITAGLVVAGLAFFAANKS